MGLYTALTTPQHCINTGDCPQIPVFINYVHALSWLVSIHHTHKYTFWKDENSMKLAFSLCTLWLSSIPHFQRLDEENPLSFPGLGRKLRYKGPWKGPPISLVPKTVLLPIQLKKNKVARKNTNIFKTFIFNFMVDRKSLRAKPLDQWTKDQTRN